MYLRVSSNGATTSSTSYSLTNAAPAKPYLQIQTGTTKWYLPLTTATVAGTRLSIKSGTSTYRPLVYSTYKTTSTAVGNMSSTTALTKESSVYYNTTTLTAIPNKTALSKVSSRILISYVYSMTNASYTNYQFYRELYGADDAFKVRDGLGMSNNNISGGYAHLSFAGDLRACGYKSSVYTNTSFVKYANGFTYSSTIYGASTFPVGTITDLSNATFQASTTIDRAAVPWVSFTTLSMTTLKVSSRTYTGPVHYTSLVGNYVSTLTSTETKTMTLYFMTGYTNAQNIGGTYTSTASIYTNSANTSGKAGIKYTMTGRYRKDYLIDINTLMSSANTQTFSTSKTTTAYSGVSSKWA